MILAKQHGQILALCDEELLGHKFVNGKLVLDLKKYSDFYRGKRVSETFLLREIKKAEVKAINAVGKKAIAVLRKAGYDTKSAIKIAGIPHLQIYKL